MVAGFVADHRDVERQPAPFGEAVDVGVIGQQPVDVGRERVRTGWATERKATIAGPLGWLVSNMFAGPRTPRASRFTRLSTSRLSGSARNARAPIRPSSSPSLNRKTIGRFSGWPFKIAATSSIDATPAPSSDAPGPAATLS